MPRYKYVFNRMLTLTENILVGHNLSEMLAQSIYAGFRIGEISCPTKYFAEASSINFRRSVVYGLGVLKTAAQFRLHRWGLIRSPIFAPLDAAPAFHESTTGSEPAQ